jgi:flavin reductase (DIM6/NTAB) family NADH-FMN oxidoreductase RutF
MSPDNSNETVFKEIDVVSINENVFKMIEEDWFLITAGNKEAFNTMTANWGGMGYLWHKNVCFIFVRPTRYTYEFTETSGLFTLSFFGKEYRKALEYCGANSGRDVDKVKECSFNPVELLPGAVSFNEAGLVLTCKKLYYNDINPDNFADEKIDNNYPKKDYHRMYIGEIIKVFAKG